VTFSVLRLDTYWNLREGERKGEYFDLGLMRLFQTRGHALDSETTDRETGNAKRKKWVRTKGGIWRRASQFAHSLKGIRTGTMNVDERVEELKNRAVSPAFARAFLDFLVRNGADSGTLTTRQVVHGNGSHNSTFRDPNVTKCVRSFTAERNQFVSLIELLRRDEDLLTEIEPDAKKAAVFFHKNKDAETRKVIFLSHAWDMIFERVVEAMATYDQENDGVLFWIDIFAVNQHADDQDVLDPSVRKEAAFQVNSMPAVVERCDAVHLLFMPLEGPLTVGRAWCWQEIAAAVHFEKGVSLGLDDEGQQQIYLSISELHDRAQVRGPGSGDESLRIFDALRSLRGEESKCFTPADQRRIHRILRGLGGNTFDYVNNQMKRKLADLILDIADKEAATTHSGFHLPLTESLVPLFKNDDWMRAKLYAKLAHQYRVAGGSGEKFAELAVALDHDLIAQSNEGIRSEFKFQLQLRKARSLLLLCEINMRSARESREATNTVRAHILRNAASTVRDARAMLDPFGKRDLSHNQRCIELEALIAYWEVRCLYLHHSTRQGEVQGSAMLPFYDRDLKIAKKAAKISAKKFTELTQPHFIRGSLFAVLGGMFAVGQTATEERIQEARRLSKATSVSFDFSFTPYFRDLYEAAFQYWKEHESLRDEPEALNYRLSLAHWLSEEGGRTGDMASATKSLENLMEPLREASEKIRVHRLQFVDWASSLLNLYIAADNDNNIQWLVSVLSEYVESLGNPDEFGRPRVFYIRGLEQRAEKIKEKIGIADLRDQFSNAVQFAVKHGATQNLNTEEGILQQDMNRVHNRPLEVPIEYKTNQDLKLELDNDIINPPLDLEPVDEFTKEQ